MADMFANARAYEARMGRWSARLAPLFAHFAYSIRAKALAVRGIVSQTP